MQHVDLICLAYNPWSRMWKRNQQIVWGLSQEPWIRKVLFINPGAWCSRLLLNPLRSLDLVERSGWSAVVPRTVSSKITVCTPLHLPLAGRVGWLGRAQRRLTESIIWRRASEPFILLVNRPEEPGAPLMVELSNRAVLRVFDWSDDFETFAESEDQRSAIRGVCEHHLRSSDVTLAVNDRLGERARAVSASAHVVRNGTDVRNFGRVLSGNVKLPRSLRGLPRPIIGYIGYRVRERLDLDLIDFLAKARPGWSFVFVGPKVGEEPLKAILRRRLNVRVVGPVDYFDLPSFVAAFDACVLPNRINAHTAGNDPIKVYDYLGAGKPVVSTAVAGVEPFGGLVEIAESGAPFLDSIERVIATDSPDGRGRRQRAARVHSWEQRTRAVANILCDALAAKGLMPGRGPDAFEAHR